MDTTRLWIEKLGGPLPRGVIHVGANTGQEHVMYDRMGLKHELWIEPEPSLYKKLVEHLHGCRHNRHPVFHTFNVACGSERGRGTLRIFSDDGHSNSLRPPKRQLEVHPETTVVGEVEVPVERLDDIVRPLGIQNFNILVVDTQGHELDCLKGAEETIRGMDYIQAELATIELYEGCAIMEEVNGWLAERGFRQRLVEWRGPTGFGRDTESGKKVYGDSIYMREGS